MIWKFMKKKNIVKSSYNYMWHVNFVTILVLNRITTPPLLPSLLLVII